MSLKESNYMSIHLDVLVALWIRLKEVESG